MPDWLAAGGAGLIAGAALLLGAVIAWFVSVPTRVVAVVMAFGSGVLISALSFELVEEATEQGGLLPTAAGFLVGSVVYVGLNVLLARHGAGTGSVPGLSSPPRMSSPAVVGRSPSVRCWTGCRSPWCWG